MKKIIFAIICFFLPFIMQVYAANYDIDNVIVDATIQTNGDVKVKELIVMDGTFHGYVRDLMYANSKLKYNTPVNYSQDAIYNASDIKDVTISAKKITSKTIDFSTLYDEDYKELTKVYYDADAVNGNYYESSLTNGYSFKMYYSGSNEKVGFLLQYTIKDAVVVHKDVAELYWTFIGDAFDDDIGLVDIKVHLPKEDTSDKFKIWAHGDLTGNVNFIDKSSLLASITKLSSGSSVDVRTTFDVSLMDTSTVSINKIDNADALEGIISTETQRANEANEQRNTALKYVTIVKVLAIAFLIILFGLLIWIYIRFAKPYQSSFTNEYNREFIDDYNVEVIDYLMNQRITPNAMSASILNLIYKKNIKVEEIPSDSKKKEYQFTLLNTDQVNDAENTLIDFLFNRVGKENQFTTVELENYAKKSYTHFDTYYTSWSNMVVKEGKKQNFFETNGIPVIVGIIAFILGIGLFMLNMYLGTENGLAYLDTFLSVMFLIYTGSIHRRTIKGNDDYVKWKAFKKFLKDFGDFEVKDLPQIKLWERYLVYATIFGLADKVQKAMNVKIQEMPEGSIDTNYYPWIGYNLADDISSSVNHSINTSRNAINASRVSSSSFSSGSGFGGGFSSGGGFGGGGGGGHGF